MISLHAVVDEPAVALETRYWSIVVWLGPLREWKLGLHDHRINQNPHWQFYFGPLSFIWWKDLWA